MIVPLTVLQSLAGLLSNKRISQTTDDNLLKHLGGMGPYVEGTGFGLGQRLAENLEVDMVSIFSRHGERYPTEDVHSRMHETYEKLKSAKIDRYEGPLAFVKHWEYLVSDADRQLGAMSRTGQFSGLDDMRQFGQSVREQYGHLYDEGVTLPVFAAGSQRVIDSATAFAQGFTGMRGSPAAAVIVLPEHKSRGSDTLTTGKTCKPYHKKANYRQPYVPLLMQQEAARLNRRSPGFNVTMEDVRNLVHYCAFELNVRGHSEVCEAISMDAFADHEYARDVQLYHTKAAHPFSFVLGSVYVNATLTLFSEAASKHANQRLWFSFSHDSDLMYYMNALGVLDHQRDPLSVSQTDFARFFRTSELLPMGARIVVERLNDKATGAKYVRVVINNAVIPLRFCQDGPQATCKLETLQEVVGQRMRRSESFIEQCEIGQDRPQWLEFYWKWREAGYRRM